MGDSKRQTGVFRGVMIVLAVAGFLWAPSSHAAEMDEWPRRFQDARVEVLIYQPQLEDFRDDRLTARAAVSARKKGRREPVFGAIWIDARVDVDRDTRMARIHDIKVTNTRFPSTAAEEVREVQDFINAQIEGDVHTIALDRLVTAMDLVEKQREEAENLRNDPPKIIYRKQPAVLVLLDGEPRLMPVPDSTVMRVVNTPFVMYYLPPDKAYYLKAGDVWVYSLALQGPWQPMEAPPQAVREVEEKARREVGRQAASPVEEPGRTGPLEPGRQIEPREAGALPEIIVSTEPSELIVTEGEPQYTPIENTDLLYVSNSENNIFMSAADSMYYVLISGRWFSSRSLETGPWAYVPSTGLPADFARIPEGSVKGFVLVSVAGTQPAREAVMDTYIPQTAAIDRRKATVEILYDGEPRFEKIPNIDVEYAVNTQDAVFKAKGKYYACVQAVWYESDSPHGPWKVSVEVAGDIYKVPPSNPHYNARYVKVYESTKDVARVGYTPGYTGSYVDRGTVVYGTGYAYDPYYSPRAYVPYSATYGYSAVYNPYQSLWGYQPVYYNPYSWLAPAIVGVGVGLAVAAITDRWWDDYRYPYYGRGWWGYGGYRYTNVHHYHYYHHRDRARWRPRATPYWRPGDRATWRPGDPSTWRPGDRPGRPGERPGFRRGERPGRPTTRPEVLPAVRPNLYNRPGMENRLADSTRVRPARPDRVEASRNRQAVAAERRETRRTRPTSEQLRRNNLYTDGEGNVFRRDNRGNWQQREGGRWSSVDRTTRDQVRQQRRTDQPSRRETVRPAERPATDTSRLNREFRARERGAERSNQFNRSQSFQPRSSVQRPSGRGDGASFGRGGGGQRGGSSFGRGGDGQRGGSGFRGEGGGGGRSPGASSRGGGGGREGGRGGGGRR